MGPPRPVLAEILDEHAFRLYKHWTHEGGVAAPFVVYWPAMIAAAGARMLARGEHHGFALNPFSRVPLGQAPWRAPAGA